MMFKWTALFKQPESEQEQASTVSNLKLRRNGFINLKDQGHTDEYAESKSILFISNATCKQSLHVDETDSTNRTVKMTLEKEDGSVEYWTLRQNQLKEFDLFSIRPKFIGYDDVDFWVMGDRSVRFMRKDAKEVRGE
jgi:hypothetical protein